MPSDPPIGPVLRLDRGIGGQARSGDRRACLIGESALRQAQGDNCHGELVEPWIVRSSRTMTKNAMQHEAPFFAYSLPR